MKVLVSGSNGFIGSGLVPFLREAGHDVKSLVRIPGSHGAVLFKADGSEQFSEGDFESIDAVINLCGRSIMCRWTDSAKKEIESSRVETTRFLASVFSKVRNPPRIFLCASATGFYGERGGEILSEQSGSGDGFLPRVARVWEQSANAVSPQTRVVNLRFGVVLAKGGGALKMVKPVFNLGLGATVGDGGAYLSWVSRRDCIRAIEFLLKNGSVSGPVNIVSPFPVTNRDFARAVARSVKRPLFLSVRKSFIKAVFGDMGREAIISSARVVPEKLLKAGFGFKDENLEVFLRTELGGV